jgi:hypothetical protein
MDKETQQVNTDFNVMNGIKLALVLIIGVYAIKYFSKSK